MGAFRLFQIVSYLLLAWLAISMLGRLHTFFALCLTVLAISNVALIWLLRARPAAAATLCRRRWLGKYVGLVAFLAGEPHPLETHPHAQRKLLLRSQRDFDTARMRAKQIVRGHDAILDTVQPKIHENQTLRKSRRGTGLGGPLASFLLVGPKGVGKRHLTRVLAKLLFGSSAVDVFDCEYLTAEALTGTKDQEGDLLQIVRRCPQTLILFENLEKAGRDVASVLSALLTSGQLKQPGDVKPVSFQETTVVLTTTASASALDELASEECREAAFHQQAVAALSAETPIDAGILNAVTYVGYCAPPTDQVKAEVVALLMKKECRDHGIDLSHVDPEILASLVLQVDDATGFGLTPQQVKQLLRKPLVAATPERLPLLSLRVRTPATAPVT